jgi:hypothetical protein
MALARMSFQVTFSKKFHFFCHGPFFDKKIIRLLLLQQTVFLVFPNRLWGLLG